MAEERVRRILSHATAAGGVAIEQQLKTPCGNSKNGGIEEESGKQGSIAGISDVSQWQAEIDKRGWMKDAVRRSGGLKDNIDGRSAVLGGCIARSGVELDESMEQQLAVQVDSNRAAEGANSMDPALNSGVSDESKTWADVSESRKVEAGPVSASISSRGWGSAVRRDEKWPIDWPVADDCIFCKIVHGYAPAFKLYEDEFCMCILDINPLCYGHSLLVPKGHFPALDATPPTVAAHMCSVVPLLSNVIMEATSCDAFNMVVNNGEAAGQVVFHTHFHIVPRYSGDGLWTNESVIRKSLSTFKDPTQLTHAVRSMLGSKT